MAGQASWVLRKDNANMQAVLENGPKKIEIKTFPDPVIKDDEVLMKHAIYRTNRKRFWKFYRMSWLPGTPLHVGKG